MFWGAFLLTPLPEHQAMATDPQHPTRRQLEALDSEGAAPSQHWRLHLPTLEASLAQSSPCHLEHALCEGKAQEMWLPGANPPNKDHLLAWLPLKPPKPFPGRSRAAKGAL